MAGLASLGQFTQSKKAEFWQAMEAGGLLNQTNNLYTTISQDTMVPPASNHSCRSRVPDNLQNISVIFGSNGIGCPVQNLGVHAPETENVQHEHSTIPPPFGEPNAPAHRGVILDLICDRRIETNEGDHSRRPEDLGSQHGKIIFRRHRGPDPVQGVPPGPAG